MMYRLIFLLICSLAIGLGWGNNVLAQNDSDMATGQEMAAAGDVKGALAVYEELTRKNPESAEAFAHLGGMQLLDQRYSEAVQSFQRAITLGDEGTRSFVGMGMAYLHMQQLGPARAAFVEAKSRGSGDSKDIDHIITWIDQRNTGAPGFQH